MNSVSVNNLYDEFKFIWAIYLLIADVFIYLFIGLYRCKEILEQQN